MDKTEINNESFIGTELKKFEIDEAGLIATANKYKGLKINGVEDKQGLKDVRMARLELKSIRVDISKKSKVLRESAVRFQKAVISREKELVDLIEPTEEYLYKEEERIEQEKEFIREQEEKREAERIQNMINKLMAVNYAVDFHQLKGLTDEQFEETLAEATIKYQEDEKRRKEEEEIERKRLAAEEESKRIEADRLKKIAEEQAERERIIAAKEAELKKAEQALLEAADKLKKAQEEETRKKREDERIEKAKKEAELKAIEDERMRVKREEEAKIEAERLEKEAAAREESERPDKEKLIKFAMWLDEELVYPVCNTEKGQQIVASVRSKIEEISNSLHTTAKRKRW